MLNDQRPNIIFIFADDWGFGDLGCHGHEELQTPSLDKLAEQGTRFLQFHVASPVCSPSRCAVMTGQYPARHHIHGHFARHDWNLQRNMPNWLDPGVHTLPALLRQHGYRTAHYGKWHLGGGGGMHGHPDAPEPRDYGYDDTRVWNGNGPTWNGLERWPFALHNDVDEIFLPHSDRLAVDEAIHFMRAHSAEPFFINLWLRTPHIPIRATEEQRALYKHIPEPKQTYYAAISEADRQIGRLLEELNIMGLAENTLVIFSSDNGPESVDSNIPKTMYCQGSTAGLRGRKRSLYEGGIRVPFIVRWPGITPAGNVDFNSLLSAVDLLPTFCRIANVELPAELKLDGVDITAALQGQPFERKKPLMWEWREASQKPDSKECPRYAIREGKYVLLTNLESARIELYQVLEDYSQINNLASSLPDLTNKLIKQLEEWTRGGR